MNAQLPKSTLQKLSEGKVFFFKFSRLLLTLDFKDFGLGVMYRLLVQVLTLVAALLPIKILLFLAPNRPMPDILAEFFDSKGQLVIALCVLMFAFIFLAYFFSKLATKISDVKVNKIVAKLKTVSIKSKTKRIKKSVDACLLISSSGLFVMCCVTLEFFVYRDLLFILMAALFISFMVFLAEKNGRFDALKTMKIPLYKLFGNIAKSIFIMAFLFIVYDVLINEVGRSFIELIVGLILIRQSSMLIAMICSTFTELDKEKQLMEELLGDVK